MAARVPIAYVMSGPRAAGFESLLYRFEAPRRDKSPGGHRCICDRSPLGNLNYEASNAIEITESLYN